LIYLSIYSVELVKKDLVSSYCYLTLSAKLVDNLVAEAALYKGTKKYQLEFSFINFSSLGSSAELKSNLNP